MGLEPVLLPWEGSVLTARRREQVVLDYKDKFIGDPSGARTPDPQIKSLLLYQLS